MSRTGKDHGEEDRDDADGKRTPDGHPAGPHAKPELTNREATPGAGALPDPETGDDGAGGAG